MIHALAGPKQSSLLVQGLPEGFFVQNEEYLRLSDHEVPSQSPAEIDGLLKEAGLRVTYSEDE